MSALRSPLRVCAECGGSRFKRSDLGFYVCTICGVQSAEIEERQEYDEAVGSRRRVSMLHKPSKEVVPTDPLERRIWLNYISWWQEEGWGRDNLHMIVFRAGMGRHKTDQEKEAQRQKIEKYEEERRNRKKRKKEKLQSKSLDRHLDDDDAYSEITEETNSHHSDRSVVSNGDISNPPLPLAIAEISMSLSLSIIYLASQLGREPLTIYMLYSAARAGVIPYFSFIKERYLPSPLYESLIHSPPLTTFFSPLIIPSPNSLLTLTQHVYSHIPLRIETGLFSSSPSSSSSSSTSSKKSRSNISHYQRFRIISPYLIFPALKYLLNVDMLAERMMVCMHMPIALLPMVVGMIRLWPEIMEQSADEYSVMVSIVFVIKLIYGLELKNMSSEREDSSIADTSESTDNVGKAERIEQTEKLNLRHCLHDLAEKTIKELTNHRPHVASLSPSSSTTSIYSKFLFLNQPSTLFPSSDSDIESYPTENLVLLLQYWDECLIPSRLKLEDYETYINKVTSKFPFVENSSDSSHLSTDLNSFYSSLSKNLLHSTSNSSTQPLPHQIFHFYHSIRKTIPAPHPHHQDQHKLIRSELPQPYAIVLTCASLISGLSSSTIHQRINSLIHKLMAKGWVSITKDKSKKGRKKGNQQKNDSSSLPTSILESNSESVYVPDSDAESDESQIMSDEEEI